MVLGKNIKKYRQRKGWKQEKLGEESGLSVTSISSYETGKTVPKADNLEKIAVALDCTTADLMRNPEDKESRAYKELAIAALDRMPKEQREAMLALLINTAKMAVIENESQ